MKLSEFKVVIDRIEDRFPEDHMIIPVDPVDRTDIPQEMDATMVEDPPVSFTDYKIVLKKGKKKVHWKTLLKEIEEKKYKAIKIQASIKSDLVDNKFSNYENTLKEKGTFLGTVDKTS